MLRRSRFLSRGSDPVPERAGCHTAARPLDAVQSDLDRILRARAGDDGAVAELWSTHRPIAERVASGLCRPSDVDDVVSEAFSRVLDQVRRGGGPEASFRAYLLMAVRHTAADLARAQARVTPTEITDELASRDVRRDGRDAGGARQVESLVLADALADLPLRWRLVVWWADVEGRPMSEIGAELGLTANASAALAFRARNGLRDAYLARHLHDATDPSCRPWRGRIPALVRGSLQPRLTAGLLTHLETCPPCTSQADQLRQVLAAAGA